MSYYVIYSTTFDGVAKFGPYLPEEAELQERHLCEIQKNNHGMAISGTPGELLDFTKGKQWTGCVFTFNDDIDKYAYSKEAEGKFKKGKKWSAEQARKRQEENDELERSLRQENDEE